MVSVIFPVSREWNSVHTAIRIIIPRLSYLIKCADYQGCNSAPPLETEGGGRADTTVFCLCFCSLSREGLAKMGFLDMR